MRKSAKPPRRAQRTGVSSCRWTNVSIIQSLINDQSRALSHPAHSRILQRILSERTRVRLERRNLQNGSGAARSQLLLCVSIRGEKVAILPLSLTHTERHTDKPHNPVASMTTWKNTDWIRGGAWRVASGDAEAKTRATFIEII